MDCHLARGLRSRLAPILPERPRRVKPRVTSVVAQFERGHWGKLALCPRQEGSRCRLTRVRSCAVKSDTCELWVSYCLQISSVTMKAAHRARAVAKAAWMGAHARRPAWTDDTNAQPKNRTATSCHTNTPVNKSAGTHRGA